ncbi:hypothetical protein GGR54DRAFT_623443 [Hypoxylon sp. NC1633]|nr:hypothetical protein GGR54DRAFT_623443 [Hypoxylon sp. NC1633]
MSGTEVIGIISGIISIVDAITKIHGAVQDASGLPATFRDVLQKMPLVKTTLLEAKRGVDDGASGSSYVELQGTLESCRQKATSLEKIFRNLAIKPGASRAKRCTVAARSLFKDKEVKGLMDRILADLQVLTASHAIKSATKEQVQDLVTEMKKIGDDSFSDQTYTMSNYGTGSQNNNVGSGTQHVNMGGGSMFSGSFSGPFTPPMN